MLFLCFWCKYKWVGNDILHINALKEELFSSVFDKKGIAAKVHFFIFKIVKVGAYQRGKSTVQNIFRALPGERGFILGVIGICFGCICSAIFKFR